MRLMPLLMLLLSFSVAPARAATPVQAAAWLEAKDPRAAAAIEALAAAAPDDVGRRVLLVRLRLQQRRAEDAVALAEEAVELAPGHAPAHLWLGNAYGNRIGEVGMISQARMASRIRAAYDRALELDPDIHDARIGLVEFHMQAPGIVGGDLELARRHAAELARRDPPRGHYARGRLATHDQKPALAAEAFIAAHAARPDNASYRMAAGVALQEAERWDEAFAVFTAWVAQQPGESGPWYQIGRSAALSGQRLDEGAAALKRYLTMSQAPGQPEPKHAWYRLGQVQARAGDPVTAKASLRRALALDPEFAEAKAELAKL